MASKKQHESFNKQVEKILIGIGAEKTNTQCSDFQYTVNTYAGLLFVSCHEADKSQIFSIFLRFKDYDAALFLVGNELGCNPKWNIHQQEAEHAISTLKWRLNKVACLKEKLVL